MKIVTQWMREEFLAGKTENIPAEALAILKAEAEARHAVVVPSVFSTEPTAKTHEEDE